MAIKRNQRQRKKMHLAEFQELGFLVKWQFAEGTSVVPVSYTHFRAHETAYLHVCHLSIDKKYP